MKSLEVCSSFYVALVGDREVKEESGAAIKSTHAHATRWPEKYAWNGPEKEAQLGLKPAKRSIHGILKPNDDPV